MDVYGPATTLALHGRLGHRVALARSILAAANPAGLAAAAEGGTPLFAALAGTRPAAPNASLTAHG